MTNFADSDLERALEESRKEYYVQHGQQSVAAPVTTEFIPMDQSKQPQRDTTVDGVVLRLGVEVEMMNFADADTLVLIGEPPRVNGQSSASYDRIRAHYAIHHKIHSQKLIAMGSAKFEKLLSVDKQTRLQRTLKRVLPEGKPPGIKYILDLRPPNEDEEAILLLTELSCTSGILQWNKVADHFSVSPLMKDGQDDPDHLPITAPSLRPATKKAKSLAQKAKAIRGKEGKEFKVVDDREQAVVPAEIPSTSSKKNKKKNKEEKPPPRIGNWEGRMPAPPIFEEDCGLDVDSNQSDSQTRNSLAEDLGQCDTADDSQAELRQGNMTAQEYSPLRHRSAIERVLSAIELQDPRLDSAPKVWNYFGIAKHLDCATHERVNGWITKWLFAFPNSNFIQLNPEICYRIGLGIKSEDLTKDAFSILVGEQALIRAIRRENPLGRVSVHGRLREHLDDDEQNRVIHAADHFVSRIQETFRRLLNVPDDFFEQSTDYQNILKLKPRDIHEAEVQSKLLKLIRGYVRRRVMTVLFRASRHYRPMYKLPDHVEWSAPGVEESMPGFSKLNETYQFLRVEERIFTRTFWTMLHIEDMSKPLGGSAKVDQKLFQAFSEQLGELSYGLESLPYVTYTALREGVHEYNEMVRDRNEDALLSSPRVALTSDNHVTDLDTTMQKLYVNSPKRGTSWSTESDALDLSQIQGKRRRVSRTPDPLIEGDSTVKIQTPSRGISDDLPIRSAINTEQTPPTSSKAVPQYFRQILPKKRFDQVNEESVISSTPSPRSPLLDEEASLQLPFENWEDEAPNNGPFQGTSIDNGLNADNTNLPGLLPRRNPEPSQNQATFDLTGTTNASFQTSRPLLLPFFSIPDFLATLSIIISAFSSPIINPPHLWHLYDRLPIRHIDTLLNLEDGEWKYLPLWAGGNDDGSGGVFDETDVPDLEAGGFKGPGPSVHTGGTPAGSSIDDEGSEGFENLGSDEGVSTRAGKASIRATDGTVSTKATVKSLSTVESEGHGISAAMAGTDETGKNNDLDPLWQLIRDKCGPPGTSDFESTIGGEEDDSAASGSIINVKASIQQQDRDKSKDDANNIVDEIVNVHMDCATVDYDDEDDVYDQNDDFDYDKDYEDEDEEEEDDDTATERNLVFSENEIDEDGENKDKTVDNDDLDGFDHLDLLDDSDIDVDKESK
ncbi:hypothetical protein UCRPC4_g06578 [Phaeomoniella chlamydospora]|uniref:Uncharacterized protein n=1 Tax=Phaeomoniella chlamydospora TaxID=158046 RepID=A0A0G2FSQ3_PHACM|nr:hypothetical protein UCRPC4_g06578 [Phaeomoniella chlamydospora]